MNCQRLQKQLPEYLEKSLPPAAQAEAESHLAICDACRAMVARQNQFADVLSAKFRQSTESVILDAVAQRRMMAAIKSEVAEETSPAAFWKQFAWPVAAAAALLIGLVTVRSFFASRVAEHPGESTVSINVRYETQSYTFRKEGNFVIDNLAYDTEVAKETLVVKN